jgi:hypothetical protein
MKTYLLLILTAVAGATFCFGQTDSSPTPNPSAPPSAPPQRSEADLEKLVAPIALYPDPLLASLLPASAYPIEIVQAARFVKDTNNISKVDSQPWDQSVKALAHFPDLLQKMNDDLTWTTDLGEAFVQDQKSVMNAIQAMRDKAQQAGNLKTTPQQVVTVTNTVVQNTVDQQVVYVTNTVVQIQPAQPDVIYVPQYNPTVVYAAPTAGEVVAASAISFGVGMAVGAVLANNCNWHSGGVYVGGGGVWAGGYHGDVNVNRNINVNQNNNYNRNFSQNNYNRNNFNQNNLGQNNLNRNNFNQNNPNRNNVGQNNFSQNNLNRSSGLNQTANAQQWHPDSSRLGSSYASSTPQSRGWGGSGTSSVGANRTPSATGFSSSSFGGGQGGFSSSGGGAQTRMASSRGASSWGGGGGGFHGGGGGRRR